MKKADLNSSHGNGRKPWGQVGRRQKISSSLFSTSASPGKNDGSFPSVLLSTIDQSTVGLTSSAIKRRDYGTTSILKGNNAMPGFYGAKFFEQSRYSRKTNYFGKKLSFRKEKEVDFVPVSDCDVDTHEEREPTTDLNAASTCNSELVNSIEKKPTLCPRSQSIPKMKRSRLRSPKSQKSLKLTSLPVLREDFELGYDSSTLLSAKGGPTIAPLGKKGNEEPTVDEELGARLQAILALKDTVMQQKETLLVTHSKNLRQKKKLKKLKKENSLLKSQRLNDVARISELELERESLEAASLWSKEEVKTVRSELEEMKNDRIRYERHLKVTKIQLELTEKRLKCLTSGTSRRQKMIGDSEQSGNHAVGPETRGDTVSSDGHNRSKTIVHEGGVAEKHEEITSTVEEGGKFTDKNENVISDYEERSSSWRPRTYQMNAFEFSHPEEELREDVEQPYPDQVYGNVRKDNKRSLGSKTPSGQETCELRNDSNGDGVGEI